MNDDKNGTLQQDPAFEKDVKKKKCNANFKRILVTCFYVAVVVFVIFYFKDIEWSLILSVDVAWGYMFFSFIVRMAGLLILPIAWKILLSNFGNKLSNKKLYSIYAQSWIGRYIPGKVAWLGGKIYFAVQEGIGKGVAVISSFLDSILQVLASMLVAAIFFFTVKQVPALDSNLITITYIATVALIICLLPPVFNLIVGLAHRVIKRRPMESTFRMGGMPILKSTGAVALGKVLSGMAVSIIAIAVYPQITLADFFYVIAVNCSATAIGMVAIFAPAGLGVKESLQIVMLGVVFPREIVLVIVTLASLQSILGDLIFYFIARVVLGFKQKPANAEINASNAER